MKGHEFEILTYDVHRDSNMATRLMTKYDDETLEPIPPTRAPGEKELVLVPQEECIVHTNDSHAAGSLGPKRDQQPLKKKGNGRGIHICGWICVGFNTGTGKPAVFS